MQMVKSAVILAALAAFVGPMAGCVISPLADSGSYYGSGTAQVATSGREPVIHAFDYSPKVVDQNSAITFTVVATDPSQRPLQYNWSATKGMLSTTTGQAVSWRPVKGDGSLDAGIATITVIISDGTYTTTGSLNINVANGTATVVAPPTASASPSAAPSAMPSATAAPVASPSPAASTAPSATPAASAAPAASGAASPAASPAATTAPAASGAASPAATTAPAASGAAST